MIDDVRARARQRLVRAARDPGRTALRRIQAQSRLLSGGRVSAPPDFVGIGVQRAGTSWWHAMIEGHPKVDPLGWTAKELHFFDERWDSRLSPEDIHDYEMHFLRRPNHIAGEWTPRYLYDPWSVPMLRVAAPRARLLVMLRDPVDRLRSGLAHAHERLGGVSADLVVDAINRGRYAAQLTHVVRSVPAEQLLVLQLEQCRLETQRWADRTFAFLDLDSMPVQAPSGSPNASSTDVDIAPLLMERAREIYADDVRCLIELLPGAVDPSLWGNVEQSA